MQKWNTLDRDVQAKQGNKDRPEEKTTKPKTKPHSFLRDFMV